MANIWSDIKDKRAAKDPEGYGRIRAIEKAASAQSDDMGERFRIRNAMRAEAGLGEEKRKRGGIAGAYDKGFLVPAAALALGPLALGLSGGGGAAGGAAGGAGTAAGGTAASMGGIPPIAAGGAGGGFSLGGIAGAAGNFLKDPRNLLKLGAGIQGITQQQKGAGQMQAALDADRARWAAGAPLRDAGREGMLNPIPVDTSSLDALSRRGNPFALPPMPLGGG